jgi:flagellar M-ring protein FliF
MNQFKEMIERLSTRQRITIIVAILGVIGGILELSHWNKERDFQPIFTNLAAEDAGQVVTRIRESNVEYRLSENGGTILVPSNKVAELRLQLASAGLPKSGRLGYELFDKTNFGATDFTEQINYHRALEGELERSVMSLAEVEQARVHITFPKDSIYSESRQPAKASVMVKLRPGAKLSPQNVLAICHLTASAVEGLAPEGVSVLDMNGNLLSRPRKAGLQDEASEAGLEYRQKIERDLMVKINSTLEPLLGAEKYRTGVSIDCDLTSGEQSEETFDPNKSVMVTSQKTEDGTSTSMASGVPGTASNLPRPTSSPSTARGGINRKTENISYQSSRLVRHTKLPQGLVKRISISVLLDQAVRFEKGKKIIDPPSAEKLKVVKDLVAGIAGVVPERGDQIIIESFPFDSTLNLEAQKPAPPAAPQVPGWGPPWLQELMKQKNFALLSGAAGAVLVLLLVGIVLLLMRPGKKKGFKMSRTQELAAGQDDGSGGPVDLTAQIEARLAEQVAIKEQQARDTLHSIKLPAVTTKKTEVLVKHIAAETMKDPVSMANVVRALVSNPDE